MKTNQSKKTGIKTPPPPKAVDIRKEIVERLKAGSKMIRFLQMKGDIVCQVQGDSMEPTIKEGDFLSFHETESVRTGTVVLVSNGRQQLVKRYRRMKDGGYCYSDNTKYPPFKIEAGIFILGRLAERSKWM